jgi:uncharacterized membrane protein
MFIEGGIVGIITYIIGIIMFNLTINKQNKNTEQPYGLHIAFFATGFFLHIIIELIGLNTLINDNKNLDTKKPV